MSRSESRELGSLGAVDGKLKSRQIRGLLDPHVHRSAHVTNFVRDRGGGQLVTGEVAAQTWTSKGAGNPKLMVWLTMSAGRSKM